MQNLTLHRMTSDARSLADRFGTQATEALIRSVSGVQETANEGLASVREGVMATGSQIGQGVAAAGGQVEQGITEGAQALTPNTSARVAWRAGRLVGRVEGAVRLAAFGVRFWWRRRGRRAAGEERPAWGRIFAQWGPIAVASVCLASQLWMFIRRRRMSA
jgi:hypothetical protein